MATKTYRQPIQDQYGRAGLYEGILAAYRQAGKDVGALTREDLGSFDEFHIRGRAATRDLARLAALEPGARVLDVGSGVGGPARTLAAEFGCRVTGLDLLPEYADTAARLTAQVGLPDRVDFCCGDARDMPFTAGAFDAVWTQHVLMNVEEKRRLFGEVRRVLRPAGRLLLYTVCSGPLSPLYFPVPWADDASANFMVLPEELAAMLQASGFRRLVWEDVSQESLAWFRGIIAARKKRPADAGPTLGLNLLLGPGAAQKAKNVVRNLEGERIVVVRGVWAA